MTTSSHSVSSYYALLGGEHAVRQLVNTFYDIVETTPKGLPLMELHFLGTGMAHVRQAQFEFLSGFLGGPQLYYEHHHHANVKRMHEHLEIGRTERDAWLLCMDMALEQTNTADDLHERLMGAFNRVAEALRTHS